VLSAVQHILEADDAKRGEPQTERLLSRCAAARRELSTAIFALAADWRIGKREPAVLRAISRLQKQVAAAQERVEERPDGLVAMKRHEITQYAQELRASRFAVTPSREIALEELLEAIVQGRPALMLGPTGTGKTTIVQELARRLGVDLEVIPGNEVTAGQLWGRPGMEAGKGDVTRDGIVARAMIEGKLLLWDEANASEEAMEKFLKFKAYLTKRAGDLVRVPAENPLARPIHPQYGFVLSGNPKGQKHAKRADFPPEVARELGEVRLEYLPEEELYDLILAALVEEDAVPLHIDELRANGVVQNLVKFVHEVQNLYLGLSAARGVAGASSLRTLVIDPGMVTAWIIGWSYARARRGDSLASYLDRQLTLLAHSEKYAAEDRMLLVQTAARFKFLTTERAKAALHGIPGFDPTTLVSLTPFAPALYEADREGQTNLRDAAAAHPYIAERLAARLTTAVQALATKAGRTPQEVESLLLGEGHEQRLQELQALLRAPAEELTQAFAEAATRPENEGGVPPPPPNAPPPDIDTSVDLTRTMWRIGEMRQFLTTTRDAAGRTLDSRLEGGSFDAQIQKYVRACADGPLGFSVDVSAIEIPVNPAFLTKLRTGIEAGAINGIVLEAYPSATEMERIARASGGKKWQKELERMQDLPLVDFLVEHFEKRGGTIVDKANRLATWRKLRTANHGGPPLWKLFKDGAAIRGIDPATGFIKDGSRTPEYIQLHKDIHKDVLRPQSKLKDAAGQTHLTFTNVSRELDTTTKLLSASGISTQTQGTGLSSIRLIQQEIDTITPTEFLALTGAMSDPKDIDTYPDPNTWEWLAAIEETSAAGAYSGSDGLRLSWGAPEDSASLSRARPVVR
jgi:hypothetical protein